MKTRVILLPALCRVGEFLIVEDAMCGAMANAVNRVADEVAAECASRRRRVSLRIDPSGDGIFSGTTLVFAPIIPALVVDLTSVLINSSALSIRKFGFGFLTGAALDPPGERFGALPFVYGTVVSSAPALFLAVPLSLGVAICLSEAARDRLSRPLGFMVELPATIPRVVYRLWAIFDLGPWIRGYAYPALAKTRGFLPLFQGPHIAAISSGRRRLQGQSPHSRSRCTPAPFRPFPTGSARHGREHWF